MKAKKMLFFAVLTAVFFVVNFSFAQVSHKECDCSKKCEKECTSTQENMQNDCTKDCSTKTGNSQGIAADTNKYCTITGELIDGSEGEPLTLSYLGKTYYFCCGGCVKKFKAEPITYIKEELKCPVMGEAADKNISTVVNGVKYYFCCQSCVKKFEKEPEKYLNKSK